MAQRRRGIASLLVASCIAVWTSTAAAVQVPLRYNQSSVNSSVPWTTCGFYGFSYKVMCTANVIVYVSNTTLGCGGSGSTSEATCPSLPNYTGNGCTGSTLCFSESFQASAVPLCLVVRPSISTPDAGQSSTLCDITVTAEFAVISPSSGLGWPVWRIVAVSVGGGLGLVMLCGLCLLAWIVCVRGFSSSIAPDKAHNEFEMNHYQAHKGATPYKSAQAIPPVPAPYLSVKPPAPVAQPMVPEAHGPYSAHTPRGPLPSWHPHQQRAGAPHPSPGPPPNPFTMATELQAHRVPDWAHPPSPGACTPARFPWPAPVSSQMYTAVPHSSPVSHKLQYPPQYFLKQRPPED